MLCVYAALHVAAVPRQTTGFDDRNAPPACGPVTRTGTDRRAEQALRWIVELLEVTGVPFQVVGGLAARAYGATRPLVDIDLYIPAVHVATVLNATQQYVTRPPEHHRDDDWDLVFMRLEYAGQPIEIGVSDDARFKDDRDGGWHNAAVDYDASERLNVLGVEVPVMPREQLLAYKRRLDRPVDRADVRELMAD